MNPLWQTYLEGLDAVILDGRVLSFGNPAAELAATGTGRRSVLSDLSHFGLIRFAGDDAQSFLQGQLTCDMNRVSPQAALYGSYCNPKGRMLASFLLWGQGDRNGSVDSNSFVMQLPSVLQASIQKRLSVYVLRAKVKLADVGDTLVRMGVAGPQAESLVQELAGEVPSALLGMAAGEHGSVIRLGPDRFELVVPLEQAPRVWEALSRETLPVGAACWDWLEIRAGIPVILPATQEHFVPQMTNLEAIGGVSFRKGCYPGQEIVARTQFLGKIKRRMHLANIPLLDAETQVESGDELFSADTGEQSSGRVVNAAPSPYGGFDVLAVLQTSSIEAGKIQLGSSEGPVLEIMPLPYSVSP